MSMLQTAIGTTVAAAVLTLGVHVVIPDVPIDMTPPIDALNMVPLAPLVDGVATIRQGEKLRVRAYRIKSRDDCVPMAALRSALDQQTGEELIIDQTLWDGGKSTERFVDLEFATDHLVPSPLYVVIARGAYPCPGIERPFEYQAFFNLRVIP